MMAIASVLGMLSVVATSVMPGAIDDPARDGSREGGPALLVSERSGVTSLLEATQSGTVQLSASLGLGFDRLFMRPADHPSQPLLSSLGSGQEEMHPTALITAPPAAFAFGPVSPNPFEHGTVLSFDLPATSRVTIATYDVRGREVKGASYEELGPGRYQRRWSGRDDGGRALPPGIYLVRIQASELNGSRGLTAVRKMLMLR